MSGFKRTTYNRPIFVRNRRNCVRTRSYQRSFGAPQGSLRFNDNLEFDADGQQKSAKGKAPQQPDRDFEACARINERKSEERIPRRSGNCYQTLLRTTTGLWHVGYNAENRPILFSNETTKVEMAYDYMGRRFEYKETVSGTLIRHERYLYRGYLQIAALDILNSASVTHAIAWDPTEPTATRPLALQIGANGYFYSFDQVKNITEIFNSAGTIVATYDYSPFGQIVASIGNVANPLTFSSEIHDSTLGLQYYNYRHLSTLDGRWVNRDLIGERGGMNVYLIARNRILTSYDILGTKEVVPYKEVIKKFDAPTSIDPDMTSHEIMLKQGASGHTYYTYSKVKCDCECRTIGKNTKYLPRCTIVIKAKICLDSSYSKNILRGIYGHEQRHILATYDEVEEKVVKALKARVIALGTFEAKHGQLCNDRAKLLEIKPGQLLEIENGNDGGKILNKRGAKNDQHGKDGHPLADTLYDPLPNSVWGEPPDEGDLHPKPPHPFKWYGPEPNK